MSLPIGKESEDQDYCRAKLRMRIFQKMLAHMTRYAKENNLTKRDIADRAGKSPAQVTRWLRSPANLQLDTISDLLLATNAELIVEVRPLFPAVSNEPQAIGWEEQTDPVAATTSSERLQPSDWSRAA